MSVYVEAVPDPEEIVDFWFSWEQKIEEDFKGYIPDGAEQKISNVDEKLSRLFQKTSL